VDVVKSKARVKFAEKGGRKEAADLGGRVLVVDLGVIVCEIAGQAIPKSRLR
jgi:hypothetical protein